LSASSLLKFAFAEPPLPGFVNRVALFVSCIIISFSFPGFYFFGGYRKKVEIDRAPDLRSILLNVLQ